MKLSKIYSNSDIFLPITFNTNLKNENLLNVIYAEARVPENKDLDLHNLGKSLFIELIDFLLLKSINSHHFLHKHKNRFLNCVFFLEILTNTGKYITICRAVEENTKISIKFHDEPNQNFNNISKEDWNHYKIAIDKAKAIIDSHLNLLIVKPWDYRQGISYFLRTQNDYNDYFQISKFSKGEDASWKPYIAHILGLNSKLLVDKYNIEKQIDKLNSIKFNLGQDLTYDEKEFDELNSIIELESSEMQEMKNKLDAFDFSEDEIRINKRLSSNIEYKISVLNDKLYNVNFDITQIKSSIEQKLDFNIDNIKKIYEEAKLYIPEELLNDYESLLEFNKKITRERNANLKKRLSMLCDEKAQLEKDIVDLGEQRKTCIEILNGDNSIKKYKALQNEYANKNARLLSYKNQFDKLKKIKNITSQINDLKTEKIKLENLINEAITNQSNTYKNIVKDFTDMGKKVFNKLVILSTHINGSGNLDFVISFKDGNSILGKETSESDGNTYKKILCVLFDLAVLRQYAKSDFYHFVYHDGIFETLEPRKKEKLLEIIHESVSKYNIQYILTIIESDLLEDKNGNKIKFKNDDIILELNDLGEQGRLFKMREF